jgi:hypothetical protein
MYRTAASSYSTNSGPTGDGSSSRFTADVGAIRGDLCAAGFVAIVTLRTSVPRFKDRGSSSTLWVLEVGHLNLPFNGP